MEGKKFGELTVINYRRGDKWLCQCSCSNFAVARGTALRTGLAKSCKDLEILSKESTNYRSMQDWIKRNKPRPELCDSCKENPVETAVSSQQKPEMYPQSHHSQYVQIRAHRPSRRDADYPILPHWNFAHSSGFFQ